MNPYARFGLVSNSISAALILGGLAFAGSPIVEAFSGMSAAGSVQLAVTAAAGVGVLVVFWVAMTEAIFPALFRFDSVRRMVLGKYYMEGTWLQSERGDGQSRMAVIDIQPDGKGFMFTGYALNENLEIESNTRIEFSRFDWPFMTYKHRNSLSDGSDGLSEGVGELQFEMNRSSARRYNGYLQYVRGQQRLKIEGVKLTKGSEVRRLRSLEGRREICAKYWELFFNRPMQQAVPAVRDRVAAPVIETIAPVERRNPDAAAPTADADGVIPRRRASDWVKESDAPKAAGNGFHMDIDRIVEEARREAQASKASVSG